MKLAGNTILITGGASGIGRGLAEAFHALGNRVIVAGRDRRALDKMTDVHAGMTSIGVDMMDLADVRQLGRVVAREFPALNVLINMAGVMVSENLKEQDLALTAAHAMIATNLVGPLALTAALLPVLVKQRDAVIMNVSSGLAFVPWAMTPTYCATKAAVHSYTQSLRYQLQQTTVQVLELVPPYVATQLMGDAWAKGDAAMPLATFISEVVEILKTQPAVEEIIVPAAEPLRYAAEKGRGEYHAFVNSFNDAIAAAASHSS